MQVRGRQSRRTKAMTSLPSIMHHASCISFPSVHECVRGKCEWRGYAKPLAAPMVIVFRRGQMRVDSESVPVSTPIHLLLTIYTRHPTHASRDLVTARNKYVRLCVAQPLFLCVTNSLCGCRNSAKPSKAHCLLPTHRARRTTGCRFPCSHTPECDALPRYSTQ